MGLDIDQLIPPEAVAESKGDAHLFELWPEHVNAWAVFVRCEDQWDMHMAAGAFGGGFVFYEGVPIERVTAIARDWLGLKLSQELLDQVRILVSEAKAIKNSSNN